MPRPAAAVHLAAAACADGLTGSSDPGDGVKPRALSPGRPAPSKGASPITFCGRPRKGGNRVRVVETGMHLPPGAHGAKRIIRARVSGFGRDGPLIGQKESEGWLAGVQSRAIGAAEKGEAGLSPLARRRAG